MKRKNVEMITLGEFARSIGVPYKSMLRWVNSGMLLAERKGSGFIVPWKIAHQEFYETMSDYFDSVLSGTPEVIPLGAFSCRMKIPYKEARSLVDAGVISAVKKGRGFVVQWILAKQEFKEYLEFGKSIEILL